VRRLLPYLVLMLLIAAPLVTATLTAVHAGPLPQGEEEPVTPESDFATFVVDIRLDLELLANEFNGPGMRPEGWSLTVIPTRENIDVTSPSLLGNLWLDLELQADEVLGADVPRPHNWIGASSPTPNRIARNLRHDLELLADFAFGEGERPDDWIGAPRLFSCSQTVQNLMDFMWRTFEFRSITPDSVINYCGAVTGEAQDALAGEGVTVVEGDIPQLLENIRGDLERLAIEVLGLDAFPPDEWLGTITIEANQMARDLSHDLELLATLTFETEDRPENWIGAIGVSPGIFVRNLRHDLEVMADLLLQDRDYLDDLGGRPFGWLGTEGFGDDTSFCASATQTITLLLTTYYRYEVPEISAPDIDVLCNTLDADVNRYAESDPEQISEEELVGDVGVSGRPVFESDLAFAYLDTGALQYMGTIPRGVPFEPWYRNFGESTMMYVVGDNFAVYVSQEWTTMPQDRYFRLPTLQGVIPETYCFADWCAGPGPTPTPTGLAPTPTPGAAPGGPPPGGGDLVLVPWNQVRVFYDQDKPETGTVLVRLELCAAVDFGCEPAQQVYNASGAPLPVINVIGSYPVFELPYGYSNVFTLQSESFYANEVWISDPTLRGVTGP
jgi:hypothetical protein